MQEYKCITTEYNSASNNGYAKIITIHKSFLNITDYHENQILFRIVQAQSYNGYIERQYFISTIKGSGTTQSLCFNEMSNKIFNNFECIMSEDNENYYVYARGGYDYVPIKVYVDYCPNPAMFDFHTYGLFNEVIGNPIQATIKSLKFNIDWQLNWAVREDRYSKFEMKNNKVTIDCVLNSGQVYDGICIGKLPKAVRPKNAVIQYGFIVKDSDNSYVPTRFVVLTTGDILITKIDFKTTECILKISYDLTN